ncbi:small integral membrane protein 19-like [Anneissia japonica]|uniref:small integral membrane protein 19-like n=1 Tax=Anneissia japonica TaxID=1529436 RepID=UPI00142551B9|nr:small integral membrane protein 19-like [Anneissia japonica]XP_033119402.1 small integral membrane protein 19-like [Anneissia japonica]XP_033119403.1 small integral membrane protein 19-like [Anneissia japonica]
MASENHGLPPEDHIDHWNGATNIYMIVIVVSIWLVVYLKKNRRWMAGFLKMQRNQENEDARKDRHSNDLKQVRLRQQLESYYNTRKWEQSQSQDHRVNME